MRDLLGGSRGAIELSPPEKDLVNGPLTLAHSGIIIAWSGEKDLAIQRLKLATRRPTKVNYGQLRLHPLWDPPRGDPRFEKIVNSLAPKESL
jgi:hypothetical protein